MYAMPACATVQLVSSLLTEVSYPDSLNFIFDQNRHFGKLASDVHKYPFKWYDHEYHVFIKMFHYNIFSNFSFGDY
jgi:hypothetical protein